MEVMLDTKELSKNKLVESLGVCAVMKIVQLFYVANLFFYSS
jgi:hypothetical protein